MATSSKGYINIFKGITVTLKKNKLGKIGHGEEEKN